MILSIFFYHRGMDISMSMARTTMLFARFVPALHYLFYLSPLRAIYLILGCFLAIFAILVVFFGLAGGITLDTHTCVHGGVRWWPGGREGKGREQNNVYDIEGLCVA